MPLSLKPNYFEALSAQDSAVELSGQIKTLAVSLTKIANDIRWMNSGPNAGLGELKLKALQPGSSIMPGKVNPVIPEAVAMACAQVVGNDATITVAGQSGAFQLNVMLPVIAFNLLQSIDLMSQACLHLAHKTIDHMEYQQDQLQRSLDRNPILITALNRELGYDRCAQIAKKAFETNSPIIDVAEQMSELSREQLEALLDPRNLV